METVEVRPMIANDLNTVAQLFTRCFSTAPWNEGWTNEAARERLASILATNGFRGFIAHRQGGPVAMLMGQIERWVTDYHFLLNEMCVEPALQRSGIGSQLLHRMVSDLANDSVKKIYLLTGHNGPAYDFYTKHHFRPSRGRIVMVHDIRKDQHHA